MRIEYILALEDIKKAINSFNELTDIEKKQLLTDLIGIEGMKKFIKMMQQNYR